MVKLILNNSESQVEGLTIEQHKGLKAVLTYSADPKSAYFTGGFVKRYSLITSKGIFPTGLLTRVKGHLQAKCISFEVVDLRKVPKSIPDLFTLNLGKITPYKEQLSIAKVANKYHRGIVSAVTGFGKSIAMALIVNELQVRTLIIVPNLELKRQLTDSFKQYFGDLKNITIENIDSGKLPKCTNYDCLIIDEAHHSAATTYRKLNKTAWKSIYYRFHFTATPFRSQSEEQILFESVAGLIIYEVDYKTAVVEGYIAPLEAYYIEVPKTKVRGQTWAQVYSELVTNNEAKNKIIADLLLNLQEAGKSALCLVKELRQGENLRKLTDGFFANGENEDTKHLIKMFNETKLKTLIGTVGVLGEGTDTRPCEFVIIAGLGKSKPQLMQNCGRGFRRFAGKDSCKIILIYDPSHKWTKAHFKEQIKIIEQEYGVVPVKLDLTT
jgi:superfamily II DNA or RNA helicase